MPSSSSLPVAVPGAKADEVVGLGGRETAHGKHAAVNRAIGQHDFERFERPFAKLDCVGLEPARSEVGLVDVGIRGRLALGLRRRGRRPGR